MIDNMRGGGYSAAMNFDALENALRSGAPPVIIALHGEDPFLRREALALVRKHVTGPDASGETRLDGASASPGILARAVATPSLFAAASLVILEEADKYMKGADESPCPVPVRGTVLVMVFRTGVKEKERARLSGVLWVACPPLSPRDAPDWAVVRARHHGLVLDRAAADGLVQRAGTSREALERCFERLACLFPAGTRLSAETVAEAVADDRRRDAFELVRHIERREPAAGARSFRRLLDGGAEPAHVLGTLAWALRRIAEGKRLARDCGELEASRRVSPKSKFPEYFARTLKAFPPGEAERGVRTLLEADLRVKRGLGDEETMAEWAVASVLAGGGRPLADGIQTQRRG
ncbi:MAG: DNA polymerase III subunit delta [Planctomycetota bacterium]